MKQEDIYQAEQDYARYTELFFNTEILTQEEYEFCKAWDAEEAWKYLNDLGDGRYLNINVYSEHEHEEFQLRMEQGL